jgi:DNA-directed RNA polymerase subunit RPC12/RpoP
MPAEGKPSSHTPSGSMETFSGTKDKCPRCGSKAFIELKVTKTGFEARHMVTECLARWKVKED